ncbi:MAG: hypothetical protein L0387_30990 [Acidobacteria bacterium]|nr:hypothetical protein [Acidobacteriota bacterium]
MKVGDLFRMTQRQDQPEDCVRYFFAQDFDPDQVHVYGAEFLFDTKVGLIVNIDLTAVTHRQELIPLAEAPRPVLVSAAKGAMQ